MKLALYAAILAGAFAGQASAQANCAKTAEVYSILADKYGEARVAIGVSDRGHVVEFWANADTGTWTAIITDAGGRSCIADQGGAYAPSGPLGDPA